MIKEALEFIGATNITTDGWVEFEYKGVECTIGGSPVYTILATRHGAQCYKHNEVTVAHHVPEFIARQLAQHPPAQTE